MYFSELIAVIAPTTGPVAILFVTVLIVVVICKRKFHNQIYNVLSILDLKFRYLFTVIRALS